MTIPLGIAILQGLNRGDDTLDGDEDIFDQVQDLQDLDEDGDRAADGAGHRAKGRFKHAEHARHRVVAIIVVVAVVAVAAAAASSKQVGRFLVARVVWKEKKEEERVERRYIYSSYRTYKWGKLYEQRKHDVIQNLAESGDDDAIQSLTESGED